MKVAVIDRVALTRTGVETILKSHFNLERLDAYERVESSAVWQDYDLMIVNLCLNQEGGLDCFGQIKDNCPDLPILALIGAYEMPVISGLKKLKIDGMIEICSKETVLVNAVKALMSGQGYCQKFKVPESVLTRRELEIVSMVAAGKTNRLVAQELFISEKTVKNHLSAIFKKLGVKSRSQIVKYAYDNGICSI